MRGASFSSVARNTARVSGGTSSSTSSATSQRGDRTGDGSSPSSTAPTRVKVSMSRANQPQVSKRGARGMQPASDTRSWVGRRPTRPQWLAGARTEPPVSEPMAKSTSRVDTTEADPVLEPPVMRSGAAPLSGAPKWVLWPLIENASSSVITLPAKAAPAASRLSITGADAVLTPDSASMCGLPQPVG